MNIGRIVNLSLSLPKTNARYQQRKVIAMNHSNSSIETILACQAKTWADQPFLIVPHDKERPLIQISYSELFDEVKLLRDAFGQRGVLPGDRVGIQLAAPHQFIICWLALLTMDAVAVPLAPFAPANDVYRTLNRVGAKTVLQAESTGVTLRNVPTDIRVEPSVPQSYAGGGVVLWTSGSTGEPKPVGIQTHALLHTAREVSRVHRLTACDRGYSPLPLFHVNAEVVAILASLVTGSTIVIPESFHRTRFWDHVVDHEISWINAVPSILSLIARDPAGPVGNLSQSIRLVRSASMALPLVTKERWMERWGLLITETYGLSEAASQVTANPMPPEASPIGSAGQARGLKLRVVGESGQDLGTDRVGAIEIQGEPVINPAWGPNHWALEKMHQGWYTTGDMGYLDDRGFLYLKGRSREVINRGGEKVFPREIEEVVLQLPEVEECAAVGAPHPILGEEVVLFVVAPENLRDDLTSIVTQHVGRMLASYKVPARVVVVSSLPIGPTGKLARAKLQAELEGHEVS